MRMENIDAFGVGKDVYSGLSRVELLLGLTSLAESVSPELEGLSELQEEDVIWAEEKNTFNSCNYAKVNVDEPVSGVGRVGRSNPNRNSRTQLDLNGFPRRTTSTARKILHSVNSAELLPQHRHQSAPVNVPQWSRDRNSGTSFMDEKEEEEDEYRLPPHELIAHLNTRNSSVCHGFGRTLKGRDLRQVRNAVLRQTGFLD